MRAWAYYNEHDPKTAAWLRELVRRGLVMDGEIDERDIQQVQPEDVRGFTRCHFFAGIGGWDYALQLARWPAERPVWTGSCPCQPFSVAGRGAGTDDARHLWPDWFRLIRHNRPSAIFGEQVASAIGHGWLDLVFDDLEAAHYACGAVVLPACSVGAPHRRDRAWFVAHNEGEQCDGTSGARRLDDSERERYGQAHEVRSRRDRLERGSEVAVGQADSDTAGCVSERSGSVLDGQREARGNDADGCGEVGELEYAAMSRHEPSGIGEPEESERGWRVSSVECIQHGVALGDGSGTRSQGHAGDGDDGNESGRLDALAAGSVAVAGPWSDAYWHECSDGKARLVPTQPEFFPLAHGAAARVVRLRGFGNAIVPQVAAAFVEASMGARE